jgi:hypothetical protein
MSWVPFLVAFVAVDMIVMIWLAMYLAKKKAAAGPSISAPVRMGPPDPTLDGQVRELIGRGQKIQAIKLVRQERSLGLKEAKDYVELIEADPLRTFAGPQVQGPLQPQQPFPSPAAMPGSLADRARQLVAVGDAAGAMVLVQRETGMSPEEAHSFLQTLGGRISG